MFYNFYMGFKNRFAKQGIGEPLDDVLDDIYEDNVNIMNAEPLGDYLRKGCSLLEFFYCRAEIIRERDELIELLKEMPANYIDRADYMIELNDCNIELGIVHDALRKRPEMN